MKYLETHTQPCSCPFCGAERREQEATQATEPTRFKFNPAKQIEDSPLSNGQRADNGLACVRKVFDYAENDLDTAVSDMLANVRHLCDREGIDFDSALSAANINWQAER